MDFSMVGVLASLVAPLAEAGISVFAVSTFDTNYLLMKEAAWEWAREALLAAGHSIR
ncbi:MAG: ACT domain-containing protein [Gemmataceae bacterium]|nr:ACT domain-containing protein [Gemmataceae bacterium]